MTFLVKYYDTLRVSEYEFSVECLGLCKIPSIYIMHCQVLSEV